MPPTTQKEFDALKTALKNNKWKDVMDILQDFDVTATDDSELCLTFLIYACKYSSSPEVMTLVFEKIVEVGDIALLKSQFSHGVDVLGWNCLHTCCYGDSSNTSKSRVVKFLAVVLFYLGLFKQQFWGLCSKDGGKSMLKSVTGIDSSSWTPDAASGAAVKEMFQRIIKPHERPTENNWHELDDALKQNNIEDLKRILPSFDVTATNTDGSNCLMRACAHSSSSEVMKLVFEKIVETGGRILLKWQLVAIDQFRRTCLMRACYNSSSPEVVMFLFQKIVEVGGKGLLKKQLSATEIDARVDAECLTRLKLVGERSSPEVMELVAVFLFELDLFKDQYEKLNHWAKQNFKDSAGIDGASWIPSAANRAEVKAVLQGRDVVAAKKKDEEEASAKNRADREAVAARMKAEEEATAAKKTAEEERDLRKKAEEEMAVWKQKYFDLLASVNNKAEEEAIVKKKSSCFICNHIYSHTDQSPSDAEIAALIDNLTVDRSIVAGKLNKDNLIGQGGSAKVFRCSVETWPTQKDNEEQALPRCAEHSPEHIAFKVFNHVDDAAIKAELKTSLLGAAGCPQILAPLGLCRWETDDGEPKAAILLPCAKMSLIQVPPLDRANATLDDVTKTLDGLLSVCKAVQHLHNKRNIIHRDIKPQNIFVLQAPSKDGGDGQASDNQKQQRNTMQYKLGDLGASKQEQALSGSLTTKTGSVGTIAYMSPEQLLGQPATRASDIYSLGLTLFKSLSEDEFIPAKFLDNAFHLP